MNKLKKIILKELMRLNIIVSNPVGDDVLSVKSEIFSDELRKYPVEKIISAFRIAGRKCKFLPSLSEIIDFIEPEQTDNEKAEIAWSQIMGEIRRVGSYGTPKISDAIARKLLAGRFNWGDLCRKTERDLDFERKDFICAYCSSPDISARLQEEIENKEVKRLLSKILDDA